MKQITIVKWCSKDETVSTTSFRQFSYLTKTQDERQSLKNKLHFTLGLIFSSSPFFSLHKTCLVVSPPIPKFSACSGEKSSRHICKDNKLELSTLNASSRVSINKIPQSRAVRHLKRPRPFSVFKHNAADGGLLAVSRALQRRLWDLALHSLRPRSESQRDPMPRRRQQHW